MVSKTSCSRFSSLLACLRSSRWRCSPFSPRDRALAAGFPVPLRRHPHARTGAELPAVLQALLHIMLHPRRLGCVNARRSAFRPFLDGYSRQVTVPDLSFLPIPKKAQQTVEKILSGNSQRTSEAGRTTGADIPCDTSDNHCLCSYNEFLSN